MKADDTTDRDAKFTAWVTDHRGIFLKVARAYTFESQDGDDLNQEMLLNVWSSLDSFRGQSLPSTWIYRVCLNTALNWRRGERRHRARIPSDAPLQEVPSSDPRPGAAQEKTELLEQLYRAIRQLAPGERSLVLLALDGMSYAEMAAVTGLTENHVGVALSRARAHLAETLKGVAHELA